MMALHTLSIGYKFWLRTFVTEDGVFFSSSSKGPISRCSGCTTAVGLLCNPKWFIQHKFINPVPLTKRHRSFNEAVLISFG
jgi:hypothetical protein